VTSQRKASTARPLPSSLPRPRSTLTSSSMLSFRAGDLLDALVQRAARSEVGAVCRRDLRRYYWLLSVALESAPPVTEATVDTLVARVSAALEQPSAAGDLSAPLFGCLDLLPGWNALQLLALADRLETLARRPGGLRGARTSSHGSEALGVRLVRAGEGARVRVVKVR
jgi:hypothetical protein